MNDKISAALTHWPFVAPLLRRPSTEADYQAMVEALDAVLDAGGADETHPLASLADYLGNLIEEYEAEHHPVL
jgi:HTH-type transcriptional regulator/antitoxin HigA